MADTWHDWWEEIQPHPIALSLPPFLPLLPLPPPSHSPLSPAHFAPTGPWALAGYDAIRLAPALLEVRPDPPPLSFPLALDVVAKASHVGWQCE